MGVLYQFYTHGFFILTMTTNEYEEQKSANQITVIETQLKFEEKRFEFRQKEHEMRMQELEFQRENDKLRHEQDKEKIRIKSAEIRKSQQQREYYGK